MVYNYENIIYGSNHNTKISTNCMRCHHQHCCFLSTCNAQTLFARPTPSTLPLNVHTRNMFIITMYGGMTVLRNTIRMNHDSEGQYTVTVVPGTVRVGTDGLRYANRASFPHKLRQPPKPMSTNWEKLQLPSTSDPIHHYKSE